ASVIPGVARCPLCHVDVPHGESGWKAHLLTGDGCSGSTKKNREVPAVENVESVEPAVLNSASTVESGTAVVTAKPTVTPKRAVALDSGKAGITPKKVVGVVSKRKSGLPVTPKLATKASK
ncbi:hypothetical protein HDU98_002154, partial [Podochytrium sp. JEL0797]